MSQKTLEQYLLDSLEFNGGNVHTIEVIEHDSRGVKIAVTPHAGQCPGINLIVKDDEVLELADHTIDASLLPDMHNELAIAAQSVKLMMPDNIEDFNYPGATRL